MRPSKIVPFLNAALAIAIAVLFFIPVYISLSELSDSEDSEGNEATVEGVYTCLDPPLILPAEDGSKNSEEERLAHTLTKTQTTCEHFALPGKPDHVPTTEREDLRWNSYVCVGGKFGLKKHDCMVYSFGIKHLWTKFPDAIEKDFGCHVYGFDPALDFIDHYYTTKIRFFNARLSNKDQQAQYRVPGPPGWKYRKFLTVIRELHFNEKPIDHLRLDITLDLWPGMSTMLKDGSLLTYVKQLSFEYDLNKKNITQNREMFTITQWLNKQGFLLAHSQPTKLSGKSFSVLYVNTKMDKVQDG